MNRRVFHYIALSALLTSGVTMGSAIRPAFAFDASSPSDINVDQQGTILRGYDAVAYFTEGMAVKGDPQFHVVRNGATYYFTSAKNRDLFAADPAKFEPQYGGFCAMGVAMGKKLDGDPQLFRVVDGKLYLNVNDAAQKRWIQDIPGFLKSSEQTWPTLHGKTPTDLN